MEIDRHSKLPSWVGFSLQPADYRRWGPDQIEVFLERLKARIPPADRRYNPETRWWSIRPEYEDEFDRLRESHFYDPRQGGLFE